MPLSESPETPYIRRTPASAKTSTNKSATFFVIMSIRYFVCAASGRQNSLILSLPPNGYARLNRDARRILINFFLRKEEAGTSLFIGLVLGES